MISLSQGQDYPVSDKIELITFPEKSSRSLWRWYRRRDSRKRLLQAINTLAHGKPFDLILGNLEDANALLSGLGLKNVYMVVHNTISRELHQERRRPLKYLKLKSKKKRMDGQHLICVSKGVEEDVRNWQAISPSSVRTIYNPLNQQALIDELETQHPSTELGQYIIHVGRFARTKRHDLLMNMMSQLKSDVKLVCLCSKPKRVNALAKQYGVEHKVIAPGFDPNPYPWIANAEAMVLASDFEGFPTVLIESLALGTQVVSADCQHGPSEILLDELRQNLVPMDKRHELHRYVEHALSNPVDVSNAAVLKATQGQVVAQQYLTLADS
ncbi:glycosyl transferase [Paraferrimonas haliotis]|uniref:Glycosyl transferase n=2 Tax=Paraferrimonas haliotis TaxID=2013866 RepID=A0AA37WW85_9GAMM|nr:glycosyl transferase [Paraferrimonas haliotis]